jgi:hypothetical protein
MRARFIRVHAAFGTGSIVVVSLVFLRTRACIENMASTTSALMARMSCNHLTTTWDYISGGKQCRICAVLTVSLHAIDAFVRALPLRYLGRKLQAAISRVQNLLVLSLPLIISVSDTQPNWSSPFLVKCRASEARDAAPPAIVMTITARTQNRRFPCREVNQER